MKKKTLWRVAAVLLQPGKVAAQVAGSFVVDLFEFIVEDHGGNFLLVSKQNHDNHVGFKNDGSIKQPKNVGKGNHAQFIVHK